MHVKCSSCDRGGPGRICLQRTRVAERLTERSVLRFLHKPAKHIWADHFRTRTAFNTNTTKSPTSNPPHRYCNNFSQPATCGRTDQMRLAVLTTIFLAFLSLHVHARPLEQLVPQKQQLKTGPPVDRYVIGLRRDHVAGRAAAPGAPQAATAAAAACILQYALSCRLLRL